MALQYLEALKALGGQPVDEVRDPGRVHALVEPLVRLHRARAITKPAG